MKARDADDYDVDRPLAGSVASGSSNMPADQELGSNERPYISYITNNWGQFKPRKLLLLHSPHISNLRLPIRLSPTTTSITSTTTAPASPSTISSPRTTLPSRVSSSPSTSPRRISSGQLRSRVKDTDTLLPAATPDPQRNWFGNRRRGVI